MEWDLPSDPPIASSSTSMHSLPTSSKGCRTVVSEGEKKAAPATSS